MTEHEMQGAGMEDALGKASPWVEFANEAMALFGGDPGVDAEYGDGDGDGGGPRLTLRVANQAKADAMAALLGDGRTFGGVTLAIDVIPGNEEPTAGELLVRAFAGNPLFSEVVEPVEECPFRFTYAMFRPCALQWRDDSLQSPYGLATKAAEDAARDVLRVPDGVFFASDPM